MKRDHMHAASHGYVINLICDPFLGLIKARRQQCVAVLGIGAHAAVDSDLPGTQRSVSDHHTHTLRSQMQNQDDLVGVTGDKGAHASVDSDLLRVELQGTVQDENGPHTRCLSRLLHQSGCSPAEDV